MPTSTVEDYLKCILQNEQAPGESRVGMGTVATALDVAPGTVTAMMKTLSDSGLVDYEPYSGVRLTDPGRRLAMHVLRRHRLLELFLVQVVRLDWVHVHDEAERLEHAVSDRLIERIDEMLGRPGVDPHGDPIPNADGVIDRSVFPSLLDCPMGEEMEVVRVGDQSASFLHTLDRLGLIPGTSVAVEARDASQTIRVRIGSDPVEVPAPTAAHVHVRPTR